MTAVFRRTVRDTLCALVTVALLLVPALTQAPVVGAEPAVLARQMIDQVNQVRAEAGLSQLGEAVALDEVAVDRSSDMAARGYFSHTTPEGQTVFMMLKERGLGFRVAAENLAWSTYSEDQASQVAFQSFLNSAPHRANIMQPEFSQIGVGVANNGGKIYFTLVFVG